MKKYTALVLSILLALSLIGCGKTDAASSREPALQANGIAMDSVSFEYPVVEYAMADTALMAPKAESAPMKGGADSGHGDMDKLIYTADVYIESTDFDSTLKLVEEMLKSCGGWIESSSQSSSSLSGLYRGNTSARSAGYTLRIPAESFDGVMDGLDMLGNVTNRNIYTDNVTAQYYDTQARLDAYEVQEQSLLRLMEKAESVEDIIAIEDKLSEVRYNIESLRTSLNSWDRQVSYSTVRLNITEVAEFTPDEPLRLSFGQRMSKAFSSGLEDVADFFSDLVLFLTEALPALAIIAALALVIIIPVKKSKRKKAAESGNKEQ